MAGRIFAPLLKAPRDRAKVSRMMGAALRRALIARKEMHKPLITKNIPKDNGFDSPQKVRSKIAGLCINS